MRLTKQELVRMEEILKELDNLEPFRAKYYRLANEYEKLRDRKYEQDKRDLLSKLQTQTYYVDPEYPEMGKSGSNGSATFTNLLQANQLCEQLSICKGYSFGFKVKYDGPGEYEAVPDYKYDHDGDIVYMTTFIKK